MDQQKARENLDHDPKPNENKIFAFSSYCILCSKSRTSAQKQSFGVYSLFKS